MLIHLLRGSRSSEQKGAIRGQSRAIWAQMGRFSGGVRAGFREALVHSLAVTFRVGAHEAKQTRASDTQGATTARGGKGRRAGRCRRARHDRLRACSREDEGACAWEEHRRRGRGGGSAVVFIKCAVCWEPQMSLHIVVMGACGWHGREELIRNSRGFFLEPCSICVEQCAPPQLATGACSSGGGRCAFWSCVQFRCGLVPWWCYEYGWKRACFSGGVQHGHSRMRCGGLSWQC